MSTRLFVGNLAFKAKDQDLHDLFATHVGVEKAEVVTDHYDGRSRGFGFVTVMSQEDAERAVEKLSGATLCGRAIRVEIAKSTGEQRGANNGHHRQDRDARH